MPKNLMAVTYERTTMFLFQADTINKSVFTRATKGAITLAEQVKIYWT